MSPAYQFESRWLQPGADVATVYDVLEDVAAYPAWWRSVPAVVRLAEDEALLLCRSRLPKTIRLVMRPLRQDRDAGVLHASLAGDLVGWSRFDLTAVPSGVVLHYTQQVDTPGRLMSLAGRLARPVLVWNHQQMMRALREDLATRLA